MANQDSELVAKDFEAHGFIPCYDDSYPRVDIDGIINWHLKEVEKARQEEREAMKHAVNLDEDVMKRIRKAESRGMKKAAELIRNLEKQKCYSTGFTLGDILRYKNEVCANIIFEANKTLEAEGEK